SVFGACFAVGNISSGLSDHLGRSKVFTPASFVAASAILLLFMAESLGGLFLPLTFAVLGGIGLGITPPTCFAAVADYFHGRNYGSIQGTVILACAIGGALGPWLGGFLHDLSGSYIVTLVIVQVLVVVSGLLMWFVDPGRNRRVAH
ncbi:MAG: MFS transporter, partial [Dehalococcoidia bacterium]|nr:MFS transporter [Dehalococcoidia bacterium]